MTPSETASYFRELIDEPDTTFVTQANVTSYLDIAYGQFRQQVTTIDPLVFATVLEFTPSASRQIDLTDSAHRVFGPDATGGTRMMQLLSLQAINGEGEVIFDYQPVTNLSAHVYTNDAYMLRGQVLRFNREVSRKLRMTYLPEHNVDWTNSSGALDDLTMFHDMVALLAYSQYSMRDGVENQAVLRQLTQRTMALTEYLSSRNLESGSYVAQVGWDDFAWR